MSPPVLRWSLTAVLMLAALVGVPETADAMFINRASKEINVKIVFYGPALAGKATTLQYIYDRTSPESKGKMITASTGTEKTMFFDLVPQGLGEIQGFKIRLHLYALHGPVNYEASRKLILKGIDAVVFVVDSQTERVEANVMEFEGLKKNLEELGYEWKKVPLVLQFNKRTFSNAAPVEEIMKALAHVDPAVRDRPHVETDAKSGAGVFDTLKAITKESLIALKDGRLKEPPPPTAEENAESLRRMARHFLEKHYGKYFGDDNPEDFEPAAIPDGVPRYLVMVYAPTKKRPYYTYATSGFSTAVQPTGGPQPRIEFLAYSSERDPQIVNALAMLGRTMLLDSDGPPWKEYDTVGLSPAPLRDLWYVLAPAPEEKSFRRFRDENFAVAMGLPRRGKDQVTFLQAVPVTEDEMTYAANQGSKVLLKKLEKLKRGKAFGWGRKPAESVLAPAKP